MTSNTSPSRYTLLGAAAILLWSTTIAYSRSLTEQLGTLTSASLIYLIAGLVGMLFSTAQGKNNLSKMVKAPPLYLWGCGALFVAYIACLYLAVGAAANRGEVLGVGLINYLWPGLSLVFSVPILHHKARASLYAGILVAVCGIGLAMSSTMGDIQSLVRSFLAGGALLPYFLALIAAICWALYTNLSRAWGGMHNPGSVPLFLLASGMILGIFRMVNAESMRWSIGTISQLLYMALFPGMLAYVLWDLAVRRGNIILVATLSYLTPLLSTGFSVLVLQVQPGAGLWIGAALVAVGAVVCKYSVAEP